VLDVVGLLRHHVGVRGLARHPILLEINERKPDLSPA
jgi:hypothetical protein